MPLTVHNRFKQRFELSNDYFPVVSLTDKAAAVCREPLLQWNVVENANDSVRKITA